MFLDGAVLNKDPMIGRGIDVLRNEATRLM